MYVSDTLIGIPIYALTVLNIDSIWTVHDSDSVKNKGKFGAVIEVNYTLQNSGMWHTFNDTMRVWRLGIVSPEAVMISLSFGIFDLPPNSRLLAYNSDRSMLMGPYTEKNNQASGRFSTSLLPGDSLILEYYEPIAYLGQGSLELEKVIHAYTDPFAKVGAAVNCHTNVCDAPEWCNQIRSVGIIQEYGGWVCTGVLLTNAERDYKPYFLTALHCGDSPIRDLNANLDANDLEAISDWVFYWSHTLV